MRRAESDRVREEMKRTGHTVLFAVAAVGWAVFFLAFAGALVLLLVSMVLAWDLGGLLGFLACLVAVFAWLSLGRALLRQMRDTMSGREATVAEWYGSKAKRPAAKKRSRRRAQRKRRRRARTVVRDAWRSVAKGAGFAVLGCVGLVVFGFIVFVMAFYGYFVYPH